MLIVLQEFFYEILRWILVLMDKLYNVFRVFAGTEPMMVDGVETNIFEFFLASDIITKMFLLIFIIAIAVGAVCCVITILKNIFTVPKEPKPHVKTLGQYIYSIIGTLVVVVVVSGLIAFSNGILTVIDAAFNPNDLTLSQQVFGISVKDRELLKIIGSDTITDSNGNIYEVPVYGAPELTTGWKNNASPDSLDLENDTFEMIFGQLEMNWINFPVGFKEGGKINIECFNYFVAYFAAITLLVVVLLAVLSLVKRLIDIIMLYLALPLVSSTVCLDDGLRFKNWRDTMVSKVLLAYGSVFAINIFMILCAQINQIEEILVNGVNYSSEIRLILILGGALAINGGQVLFSRILGTSAEESREMGNSIRTLFTSGAAAAGGLRAVKAMTLGGTTRYGAQYKGAVPTLLGLGGKAAFGRAYTATNSAFRQGAGLLGALRAGKEAGVGGVFGGIGKVGSAVAKAAEPTIPNMMDKTRESLKNNIKMGGKK